MTERPLPYATDEKRWGVLYRCSFGTIGASALYAVLYLVRPEQVERSLLGALATHQAWAGVQLALSLGLLLAQRHGGPWLRMAHAIGLGVQTFYALMWLASGLIDRSGLFVAVGVGSIALMHWAMSSVRWPLKNTHKGRGRGRK